MPEIRELAEEVRLLRTVVVKLLASSREGILTLSTLDIAKLEHVAPSQLYQGGKERYLLPRFGESAYPSGSARWPLEEYLEWRSIDPNERHEAWMTHLEEQKRRTECRKPTEGSASGNRRNGTA